MSRPTREVDGGVPRSALSRALVRFAAAVALAALLVGVGSVLVADLVSHELALREARNRGQAFARVAGGPLVSERVLAGDQAAVAEFSRVMRNRLEDPSMAHIKVWERGGRVLWADEPSLQGRTFALETPVAALFGTRDVVAEVSPLTKQENVARAGSGALYEVYAGARAADGTPIVVESIWSHDRIADDTSAILVRVLPLPIGALALLLAAVVPLAITLARRVERAQAESRRSLQHALAAADLERRRLARDLHDGVMQDVSGAGYVLSAALRTLPPQDGAHRLVDQGGALVREASQQLRSMLAEIYPADVVRDGLADAVRVLGDRLAAAGVEVHVEVDDDCRGGLAPEIAQTCYRIVREGLRNVQRHAQADQAQVRVVCVGPDVTVRVCDDGRGLVARDPGEGHLGLRLLRDAVADLGGTLTVEPATAGGTVLTAVLPRWLPTA